MVMMMVVMMMMVHHRLRGRLCGWLRGVLGESRRNAKADRQSGGGENDLFHLCKTPFILGIEDRRETA